MTPTREFPTSETTKIKLKAMVSPIFAAAECFRLEQLQELNPLVVVFMSTTLQVSLQVYSRKALMLFNSCCSKRKERFSMKSLFASNFISSFQIFALLTLFSVIHTEFA